MIYVAYKNQTQQAGIITTDQDVAKLEEDKHCHLHMVKPGSMGILQGTVLRHVAAAKINWETGEIADLPVLSVNDYWRTLLIIPHQKYQVRTPEFVTHITQHDAIAPHWLKIPKLILDQDSDWCDSDKHPASGKIPWYPGNYRLHHWDNQNKQYIPIKNPKGDDPEGVLYIGKSEILCRRIILLRNTHVTGKEQKKGGHLPLTREQQIIYPINQLAISWVGCANEMERKLEKDLINKHKEKYGRLPLLNRVT